MPEYFLALEIAKSRQYHIYIHMVVVAVVHTITNLNIFFLLNLEIKDPHFIANLLPHLIPCTVSSGDVLYFQKEICSNLYIIVEGALERFVSYVRFNHWPIFLRHSFLTDIFKNI